MGHRVYGHGTARLRSYSAVSGPRVWHDGPRRYGTINIVPHSVRAGLPVWPSIFTSAPMSRKDCSSFSNSTLEYSKCSNVALLGNDMIDDVIDELSNPLSRP